MRRLVLLVVVLGQGLRGGGNPNPCDRKVPPSLIMALKERFVGFRPGRLTDQTEDTTQFNRRAGGNGCVTVAEGDYDGDGKRDFVVLLTNPRSGAVRLVVALRRGSSWVIHELPNWCGPISRCYVETAKPGVFRRAESLDTPLASPDELDRIESRTESVLSGTIESNGIAHVYRQGC